MSDKRHPNVVNAAEVAAMPLEKGQHKLVLRRLGAAAGTQMMGATLTEVAPHARSFPFHYHCATEEALYVLSGSGLARIGESSVRVGPGDFVAFPAGPTHPHQMINDGDVPLVYLCLSAVAQKVDVVAYPDSKKVAATAGTFDHVIHRWISKEGDTLDYWAGEPHAE